MEHDKKLIEWTNNNELAMNIFDGKYKYEDETFDETIDRISGHNENVKKMILNKEFLPGGRICANRGLDHKGRKITMSNCYVMKPVEDNIESIFDTAKELARTYSYGGGCGVDISNLAFKGAKINNAARLTSGAISFMDLYSMVTDLIGQEGRRGALMISMDVDHPDIEDFVTVKTDLNKVTKANISVKINDAFMDAVKHDRNYMLYYMRKETKESYSKEIKARDLFHLMAKVNWDYAEPGMLFWDRFNSWHMNSNNPDFKYAGVNPCGELCLPEYGACLLGSINLSAFVVKPFSNASYFNYLDFCKVVKECVYELNRILDEGADLHPLEQQRQTAKNWRQIGLGIMGLADMLIKLGITYGSDQAIELCDVIGRTMAETAIKASNELAKKEKKPFNKFNYEYISKSNYFIAHTNEETRKKVEKYGLRNSQLLTIAPTGSLSNVLGISGGIEPIFANSYTRKTESLHGEDVYYKVYTPIVKEYMDMHGLKDDSELPEYFVTSKDIPYENRIKMQAVWQKHIDASISSTVNLPESATVEDIEDLYMKAWENGLKGITVYRDKCKRSGILTTDTDKKKEEKIEFVEAPLLPKKDIEKLEEMIDSAMSDEDKSKIDNIAEIMNLCIDDVQDELKRGEVIKVTDNVFGLKRKLITGCGTLHCIAMFDDETKQLVETYLSKGSTGGCNNFMIGLSRMISIAVRGGISIYDIVDQLDSTGVCPSYATRRATKHDTSIGSCCPMAVGKALIDMYEEANGIGKYASLPDHINQFIEDFLNADPEISDKKESFVYSEDVKCPQCGAVLEHEGGCDICKNCGWTRCD